MSFHFRYLFVLLVFSVFYIFQVFHFCCVFDVFHFSFVCFNFLHVFHFSFVHSCFVLLMFLFSPFLVRLAGSKKCVTPTFFFFFLEKRNLRPKFNPKTSFLRKPPEEKKTRTTKPKPQIPWRRWKCEGERGTGVRQTQTSNWFPVWKGVTLPRP